MVIVADNTIDDHRIWANEVGFANFTFAVNGGVRQAK